METMRGWRGLIALLNENGPWGSGGNKGGGSGGGNGGGGGGPRNPWNLPPDGGKGGGGRKGPSALDQLLGQAKGKFVVMVVAQIDRRRNTKDGMQRITNMTSRHLPGT